jgi:predicted RNase H-like nuclease (RuvC/YqgF family)
MAERPREKEQYLELPEEEDQGPEHLDSQVQKAQEQLLSLKRQQEQIERQKRELEELSRRQEQLQEGRTEMVEQFTRAIVVLERETYDAQKRVEQLKGIHDAFVSHLDVLESINPKAWDPTDINKELNKALSAVDDARAEYARSRAVINAESSSEVLAEAPPDPYQNYAPPAEHDFVYWLKSGLAFTLPLCLIGLILVFILISVFGK